MRFEASVLLLMLACSKTPEPTPVVRATSTPVNAIPGHESLREDTTHKEGPRLMVAETYMRSYLAIFGGLSPLDSQAALVGAGATRDNNLFDRWADYLAALGMPDYKSDIDRSAQTNALMVAAFERTGIALCDRAVENDLRGSRPVDQRIVFAFEGGPEVASDTAFATRFDIVHRTFLGYPAELAPTTNRTSKFYNLYKQAKANQTAPDAGRFRLTADEAAWAAVCYALIRHPEFHFY